MPIQCSPGVPPVVPDSSQRALRWAAMRLTAGRLRLSYACVQPSSHKVRTLLNSTEMCQRLEKLADQIAARWADETRIALVGVYRRGVPFSERLAELLCARGKRVDLGRVDITQYRDDLNTMKIVPKLEGSDIPFDVDDAVIILCDEVLFTGRTSRAALEELLDYGRPRCVQFAVLVDRHGRELPLHADYAGITVTAGELTLEQRVSVRFKEGDGWDEVFIRQLPSTSS